MKQYTFHAKELELREQASMLHPHEWLRKTGSSNEYANYCEQYANNKQSLSTIPCSPQCREVWKDGQSVKEDEFEVEETERPYPYTPTFVKLAYPIQQEESEDKLWDDFIDYCHDNYTMAEMKETFNPPTRRKQ